MKPWALPGSTSAFWPSERSRNAKPLGSKDASFSAKISRAFRLAHVLGMAVVAAEALLGVACPLTEFESALRSAAQAPAYGQSFIAHWLGRLLFYDFDEAVFAGAYLIGLGVTVWAWRRWPVRKRNAGEGGRG